MKLHSIPMAGQKISVHSLLIILIIVEQTV